ncbi:MAG: hypothetical protein IKF52_01705 [Clostridia bacterium]|nr:hypothetical protein [Clostridia bacterium]
MKEKNETPVLIKKEFLYNLDLKDEFFSSLRVDYKGFDQPIEAKGKLSLWDYDL